jgi:hypothetical protein
MRLIGGADGVRRAQQQRQRRNSQFCTQQSQRLARTTLMRQTTINITFFVNSIGLSVGFAAGAVVAIDFEIDRLRRSRFRRRARSKSCTKRLEHTLSSHHWQHCNSSQSTHFFSFSRVVRAQPSCAHFISRRIQRIYYSGSNSNPSLSIQHHMGGGNVFCACKLNFETKKKVTRLCMYYMYNLLRKNSSRSFVDKHNYTQSMMIYG